MADVPSDSSWTSRKFWQSNGIVVIATGLCLLGRLDGTMWSATVLAAAGWYGYLNTRASGVDVFGRNPQTPGQPPPPTTPDVRPQDMPEMNADGTFKKREEERHGEH